MNNLQTNPKGETAAVYMRVSTANQEEEKTIDGQWMEIRERITKDGVNLPEENIYKDEGWSGALIERPELDRLRSDANTAKFTVLYIYDRGRLSRNFIHQEIILGELREKGIRIVELHGISGDSMEEVMMGQMMGVFHQYEREKIKERMRLGKMRIVKENKELLGYNPCFGYDLHRTVKTGADKHRAYFSINEEEAEIVRYIYSLCASGLSVYAIKNRLNEEGYKSPRGGQWGRTSIRRILGNETYAGRHYYNKLEAIESKTTRTNRKYKKVAKNSRRVRPKTEWLPIDVEPIIDEELFNKAQEQLKKNAKFNSKNAKNRYLLTGLVHCPCGKARTGDPGSNGHTYYRCTDRLSPDRKCKLRGVNSVMLDEKVYSTLFDVITQPSLIRFFAKKWTIDEDSFTREKQRIEKYIVRLEKRYEKFIDALGDGILSEDEFRKKADEIAYTKEKQLKKLADLQERKALQSRIEPEKLTEIMLNFNKDELSFEEKRTLVQRLITNVIASQEEVIIYGKVPIVDDTNTTAKPSPKNDNPFDKNKENDDNILNITDRKVGFEFKDWDCWFTKCREVDIV